MKKLHLFTLLLVSVLLLSSCGQNTEQIVAFQNELYATVNRIETLHNDLNQLDVTAYDAVDTALEKLSGLDAAFKELADIDIADEEYAYLSDLAKEGSDYMSQAYELFEKAYTAEPFDEANADLAYKYLERATTRIRVIVSMIHGEVPDGVIVH